MPVESTTESRRVLIGGVGYTNLRDLSLGPEVVRELQPLAWPPGVEVDDLSPGGPIANVHRFREAPPYDRVVLFGAVGRGRPVGTITCYRWDRRLPDAQEIQARVAEAVTGVISLDNLLIVGGYFAIWPPDLLVVEVEPRDETWGETFSPSIQAVIPALIETLRLLAVGPVESLPSGSCGMAGGSTNDGKLAW